MANIKFSKVHKSFGKNKIISDCCEALIGAIFLDSNLEKVEKFILKNWNNLVII